MTVESKVKTFPRHFVQSNLRVKSTGPGRKIIRLIHIDCKTVYDVSPANPRTTASLVVAFRALDGRRGTGLKGAFRSSVQSHCGEFSQAGLDDIPSSFLLPPSSTARSPSSVLAPSSDARTP